MPSPRSVHWLLDIDGVINAERPGRMRHDHPDARLDWNDWHRQRVVADQSSFMLHWSNELLDEIRKLTVDFPSLEILLCSTWCMCSENLLPALGFDWPLAFTQVGYTAHSRQPWAIWEAKETAVQERIDDGIPVIWTDDEANEIWTLGQPMPGVLMIAPESKAGLNRLHLELIRKFLEVQTYA